MSKEWSYNVWKDVLDIRSGRGYKEVISPDGIYPILGSSGKVMAYADNFICEEGTTIVGRKGTIDNPLFIEEKFWNVDTAFGLHAKDHLDKRFLYYFCRSFDFKSMDRGSGRPSLVKSDLLQIEMPIPPLPEQKAIVKILDQAFTKIDQAKANIEKNIENAKELTDSYFLQIFESKTSEEQSIEFGKVVNLSRGHNPPKSKFISEPKEGYVRFYQIRDGWSDNYKVYVPDDGKLHKVSSNEILMVAYRHIGRAFRGVEGAFNVALCKISNKDSQVLDDDYLFELIPSPYIKGELLKRSERSLIPSMSVKHLEKIKIPLPEISIQEEIKDSILKIKKENAILIKSYERKIEDLEELKKSLLQKAFSGELTKTEAIA